MARRGRELSEWLPQVAEEVIEPELPICDPHHHLWDFGDDQPRGRYLLDDLLEDTGSGHNVVSTGFVECTAMHRATGPDPFRPVGETEFANGIDAMCASGVYGGILMSRNGFGFEEAERPPTSEHLAEATRAYLSPHDRLLRAGTMHVREQLPRRPREHFLSGPVE